MEPNPLTYLLPHELEDYLLALGWSKSKIPGLAQMESILRILESRIDAWFGYRLAPTNYEEELVSNENNIVLLHHYPVISIEEVKLREIRVVSTQINYLDIPAVWQGGRSISTPTGGGRYRVKYVAGYEPLPFQLKDCLLAFIHKFIKSNGDASLDEIIGFSMNPVRHLTNVGLPGGISQTYRVSDTSKTAGGFGIGGTELDQAFLPLVELKMRRSVIT